MSQIQPIKAASCAACLPQFDPSATIIRMPELEAITGLARPTVYKRLKDDPTFPLPVPLSDSKSRGAPVGWVLAEVQDWVRKRIALRVPEMKKATIPEEKRSQSHGQIATGVRA